MKATELLPAVRQQLNEARKANEDTIHTIALTPQGEVVTVSEVYVPTRRGEDRNLWKRLGEKVEARCGRCNEIVSITSNEFLIGIYAYDAVDDDILLDSLNTGLAALGLV